MRTWLCDDISTVSAISSQDDAVDRKHPLAQGLMAWYMAIPTSGGQYMPDLLGGLPGVTTSQNAGSQSKSYFRASGIPFSPGSILLDGSTDYVQLPLSQNLDMLGGNVTIVAWFWLRSVAAGVKIIASDVNSGGTAGRAALAVSTANLLYRMGSGTNLTGTRALTANQWYMGAATHYGVTGAWNGELYLNGAFDQSTSTATNPDAKSNAAVLGRQGAQNGSYFPGQIDNVMFYSRRLYPGEFQELYHLGLRGFPGLLKRIERPRVYSRAAAAAATNKGTIFRGGILDSRIVSRGIVA